MKKDGRLNLLLLLLQITSLSAFTAFTFSTAFPKSTGCVQSPKQKEFRNGRTFIRRIRSTRRLNLYRDEQNQTVSVTSSKKHYIRDTKSGSEENLEENLKSNHRGMEKLSSRLQSCGIRDFYFVNDDDELDQMAPTFNSESKLSTNDDCPLTLKKLETSELSSEDFVHVKTLVWKGMYLENSTEVFVDQMMGDERYDAKEESSGDGTSNPTASEFYFVTALRMKDKVDTRMLREIIRREWPKKNGGTLLLSLADQTRAEVITGFSSGSMPPAWHSFPLTLFIDENVLNGVEGTEISFNRNSSNERVNLMSDRCANVTLSVGSGTENYSLHVSLLDTIASSCYYDNESVKVANALGMNLEFDSGRERYICSFARQTKKKRTRNPKNNSRSLSNKETLDINAPIELTRKLFHVTAKKTGKTEEVRQMIEAIGDDLPSFMRVDEDGDKRHFGVHQKNALHYAAWKGDLETITLLINASKQYEDELGNVVNIISTGEGNFGKSPIFYAITQCRDDAVLHLCSHGASLLIVNNKGQTPCSLAVNKLKQSTCNFLFQMEEMQIKNGGAFMNYRSTDSDGKRYGDLDPRFLVPGDINLDIKVRKELEDFREFCVLDDDNKVELALETNPFFRCSLSDNSLPRSVKVTTPIWRQESWLRKQEEKRALQENLDALVDNNAENPNEISKISAMKVTRDVSKDAAQKGAPLRNSFVQLLDGSSINMTSLEYLKLKEALVFSSEGTQITYELVNNLAGVLALSFAVEETLELSSRGGFDLSDADFVSNAWGLDCEWGNDFTRASGDSPVATLQLSSGSRSFVVDLQTICQSGIIDTASELSCLEEALADVLTKLLSQTEIPIIGFGIPQDLSKLAASFPHMKCFARFDAVLDLQPLAHLAYPNAPKNFIGSLQKAVAILLRKRLDKTEQCSDWTQRPLHESQLEYGALDATVLPMLLKKMVGEKHVVEKYNGFFLSKQNGMFSSYRFTFVEGDGTYRVAMGSIKTTPTQKRLARQLWPTFRKKTPPLPEKIPLHEFNSMNTSRGDKSDKQRKRKERIPRQKRNPIDLTLLSGHLPGLPSPGIKLGYTKESCISRVIREEVLNSLPKDSYLKFNRRGGIIEIGNAWLLFVNFGVGRSHHKYRNEFLDEGRRLTFTINPAREEDAELFQNLLLSEDSATCRKSVLLFIREGSNDKFMFIGDCKCLSHTDTGDLVNLVLELEQYDALKTEAGVGYRNIVSTQNAHQYDD